MSRVFELCITRFAQYTFVKSSIIIEFLHIFEHSSQGSWRRYIGARLEVMIELINIEKQSMISSVLKPSIDTVSRSIVITLSVQRTSRHRLSLDHAEEIILYASRSCLWVLCYLFKLVITVTCNSDVTYFQTRCCVCGPPPCLHGANE